MLPTMVLVWVSRARVAEGRGGETGFCSGIVGMINISCYIICILGAKLTTVVIVNVYKTDRMKR